MSDRIVFTASDRNGEISDLWVAGGAYGATSEIDPAGVSAADPLVPLQFVGLGNVAVFDALAAGSRTTIDLWVTDGTASGTHQIALPSPGISIYSQGLVAFGDKAVFVQGGSSGDSSLWITDGTSAGTVQLAAYINPDSMAVVGNTLYFQAEAPGSDTFSLWRSDGTAAGTAQVGPSGTSLVPDAYAALGNGSVVFESQSASLSTPGDTLWVTDGTAAGTRSLGISDDDPNSATGAGLNQLVSFGSDVLFTFYDTTGTAGLWITDGTSGGSREIMTAGTAGAPRSVSDLTVLGSRALFLAQSAGGVASLWSTDGTAAGTAALDLGSFTEPTGLVAVGSEAASSAATPAATTSST